jgi:hypothetical protein
VRDGAQEGRFGRRARKRAQRLREAAALQQVRPQRPGRAYASASASRRGTTTGASQTGFMGGALRTHNSVKFSARAPSVAGTVPGAARRSGRARGRQARKGDAGHTQAKQRRKQTLARVARNVMRTHHGRNSCSAAASSAPAACPGSRAACRRRRCCRGRCAARQRGAGKRACVCARVSWELCEGACVSRRARTASAAASGWRTCPAPCRAGCCGSRSCAHTRTRHARSASALRSESLSNVRVTLPRLERTNTSAPRRHRAGEDVIRYVAAHAGGARQAGGQRQRGARAVRSWGGGRRTRR